MKLLDFSCITVNNLSTFRKQTENEETQWEFHTVVDTRNKLLRKCIEPNALNKFKGHFDIFIEHRHRKMQLLQILQGIEMRCKDVSATFKHRFFPPQKLPIFITKDLGEVSESVVKMKKK